MKLEASQHVALGTTQQLNDNASGAGDSATAQVDSTQKQLDVLVHASHRKYEAWHANELESQEGMCCVKCVIVSSICNSWSSQVSCLSAHAIQAVWSWNQTFADVLLQVELKTNPDTPDSGSVQKAADFVQAFILGACPCILVLPYSFLAAMHIKSCWGRLKYHGRVSMTCMQAFFAVQATSAAPGTLASLLTLSAGCAGFDVADAIALLRLDDLYVEVFEVKDVKVWSATQHPAMCCTLTCSRLHPVGTVHDSGISDVWYRGCRAEHWVVIDF